MIPFFRKIRKDLSDKNQFFKYSRYAIGEIILVVIGILIALQINNWNEDRKSNNVRIGLLKNLKEEFNFNKSELNRVMKLNESNFKSALTLTEKMSAESLDITEKECGVLITGSLVAEIQYRPSNGALSEVLSAGQLSIFKEDDLKSALASWNGAITKIRFQEQEHLNFRLKALDLIHSKGNMKRVYHQQFEKRAKIDASRFETSNLGLLRSTEFENLMSSFYMTAFFLNDPYYTGLMSKIEEILLLIDKELRLYS